MIILLLWCCCGGGGGGGVHVLSTILTFVLLATDFGLLSTPMILQSTPRQTLDSGTPDPLARLPAPFAVHRDQQVSNQLKGRWHNRISDSI